MKWPELARSVSRTVCLVLALAVGPVQAAAPRIISYQGHLTTAGGQPVNGTLGMTFALYAAPSGGTALWSETQGAVAVSNGMFNALLGSVTPITLPFDAPYYLGVAVGGDAEMAPRQALAAAGYAFRTLVADTAVTAGSVAGSGVTGAITGATVPGSQVTGAITAATIGASQITGTLSDAGKVANSATSAASSNTANAIVSRDGSGNFSAGAVSVGSLAVASSALVANLNADLLDGLHASAFVQRGQVTKYINLNCYGVQLTGSARVARTFADSACVAFPDSSSPEQPQLDYGFVVPDDYVGGTGIYLEIFWKTSDSTGKTTVCINNNWASRLRPGETVLNFNAVNPGCSTTSTTANLVIRTDMLVSTSLAPGDAVVHGIFRLVSDTSTADVFIGGLRIRYTAQQ